LAASDLFPFLKSSGQVLPLGDTDGLTSLVTTSLTEAVSVATQARSSRTLVDYNVSLDSATQKLYKQLVAFNVQLDTLAIDNYYQDIAQARRNVNLWANAKKCADVRDKIEPVRSITRVVFVNLFYRSVQVPGIRINEKYLGGGQPQAVTKKQAVSLNQVSRLTTGAWIVFFIHMFLSRRGRLPALVSRQKGNRFE